jgi:photosystem II stability/assembly factor-like uncharacterized protein
MKKEWQVTRWPPLMLMAALFGMGPATAWAGMNVWTSLGPEGGSIQSLVVDPQTSSTVYALTTGGIFKSSDGTAHWRRVYPAATSDGAAAYPASVLAIDPQNTNTLYVGTAGSPATVDGGVFKSTDGGASWSAANSGLPSPSSGSYRTAKALAVDPRNSDVAYVGIVIQCVAPFPCTSGEVFKTTDGGASWNAANSGLPNFGVTALLIDPRNPSTVYAGTVANSTLPPPSSDGGRGIPITNDGGIFKSTDGAANWTAVTSGLPRSYWYDRPAQYKPINALAINPQDTSTLYAATAGGGISKTADGGATWVAGKNALFVNALAIDPQDPSIIYAGTLNYGLLKSTDGGATFNNVSYGPPDNTADSVFFLAMDRQNPSTLYAGSRSNENALTAPGGTFKSTDGAESWSPVNTSGVVATNINSLAVGPDNAGTLYAATNSRVVKNTDNVGHWNEVYSAPLTDDGRSIYPASVVAIDPQAPSTIYVAIGDNSDGGGGVFKSEDGGTSWARYRLPLGGGVRGMAIDTQNSGTVYAWTHMGIFKSTDGAANWSQIAGDKTKNGPRWCFDFPGSVAIDPQNTNTLYVGTCPIGGGFFKSTDGGKNWSALTINSDDSQPPTVVIAGQSFNPQINLIIAMAIDPRNSSTVYVSTYAGGMFKTTDGGASWNAVPVNPNSSYVGANALAIDPQNSSTVYAATTSGVFKSADGGASWRAVNAGLTTLRVQTLAIDPLNANTVYAGSNGGVFAISFAP